MQLQSRQFKVSSAWTEHAEPLRFGTFPKKRKQLKGDLLIPTSIRGQQAVPLRALPNFSDTFLPNKRKSSVYVCVCLCGFYDFCLITSNASCGALEPRTLLKCVTEQHKRKKLEKNVRGGERVVSSAGAEVTRYPTAGVPERGKCA